jgi:hypothetical protein
VPAHTDWLTSGLAGLSGLSGLGGLCACDGRGWCLVWDDDTPAPWHDGTFTRWS